MQATQLFDSVDNAGIREKYSKSQQAQVVKRSHRHMDTKMLWQLTYISVLSMRYHPKNTGLEDARTSSKIARAAADLAIIENEINEQNHVYDWKIEKANRNNDLAQKEEKQEEKKATDSRTCHLAHLHQDDECANKPEKQTCDR